MWTETGSSRPFFEDGGQVLMVPVVVLLGVLAGGAAEGLVPVWPVLVALGLPALAGVVALALVRFEYFVLLLLVIRPVLDVFAAPGAGSPASMAAGGAFLFAGGLWLVIQVAAGEACRPSAACIAVAGLALAVCFSVIAAEDRLASSLTASRVLAGLLMIPVLEQLLAQRRLTQSQLVSALLLSAIVPVLYGLVEIVGPTPIDPVTGLARVSSTFVHPNALATFLVLVSVSATGRLRRGSPARLPTMILAGLAITVLGYTFTRIGYLALLAGCAYVAARHSKRVLVALVVAAVASGVFIPSIAERFGELNADRVNDRTPANSIEWRFQYWSELIPLTEISPGTGIGAGMVLADGDWSHAPHNVWLQLAVETGAPGLLAAVAAVGFLGRSLRRRERNAPDPAARTAAVAATGSALAFLAQTGSENLLDSTLVWWFLAAAMGIGTSTGSIIRLETAPDRRVEASPRTHPSTRPLLEQT